MDLFLRALEPAQSWHDRYPLGNGSIGVMEKGDPLAEEIGLNEASFWSGTGCDKHRTNPGALRQVRAALADGKVARAEKLVKDKILGGYTEGYLPVGDLKLERKRGGDFQQRVLDLDEGVHTVAFGHSGVTSFVSHPDGVYVRCECGDKNDGTLRFTSKVRHSVQYSENGLEVCLQAPASVLPIYKMALRPVQYRPGAGVKAYVCLRLTTDGEVQVQQDGIFIRGYTHLLWCVAIGTTFDGKSAESVRACAEAALRLGFERLKERHVADVSALMGRVRLQLNGVKRSPENTREALIAGPDEALIVTLFQFGRYLAVAGQRGNYPANLQGIWNDQLRPPWSSNYTLNINTEMNLWGAYVLNLPECGDNLLPFVERLAARGQKVARDTFGLSGWSVGHNSDIWAHACPVGHASANPVCWGFYLGTAGWLCNMLYDRYRFLREEGYLQRIRPLLAGALAFYMDYATWDEESGCYRFTPSVSPENRYRSGKRVFALAREAAMDNQIVAELAANYLELSAVLGEDETTRRVRDFAPKIAPTRIGADGRVLEWGEEKEEAEPTHRHLSHLWFLYPGVGTPTEQARAAALRSLEARGDEGTGWSLAWKVCLYARLQEGDHALKILKRQLMRSTPLNRKGGSYDSLLGAHPPFQIDSNYGVAAGIAEMLVQSQSGQPVPLPALPKEWKRGSVTGLRLRGGGVVDVSWEEGSAPRVCYHESEGVK